MAVASILTFPLSVAQARIETQGLVSWLKPSTWNPTAFFKVFADLYKEEGFSFIWRGFDQLVTSLVLTYGMAILEYSAYSFLLDYVATPRRLRDPEGPFLFLASHYVGVAEAEEEQF